jgi:predicted nucleic acid-binding protein
MPKATITFDLPEEQSDYEVAMNAGKMYCALFEIYNVCRSEWKHNQNATEATIAVAEIINDLIPSFILGD